MTIQQFFIKRSQITEDAMVTLEGSDARHIRLVLRLKKGSRVRLVDDEQNLHEAVIEKVNDSSALARILESRAVDAEAPAEARLTVVQGVPRLQKADLIVRMLTELGASEIVFTPTERSPYRDAGKRVEARLDRLRRIAAEASKQCLRRDVPRVSLRADLAAAVEALDAGTAMLMADESTSGARLAECLPKKAAHTPVAIFVGPEGGFSSDEARLLANAGAKPFSLGRNILRTETAALVAAALVLYETEEI
jgi:16S rRNA (uracil1498-N3)-methyltransferase